MARRCGWRYEWIVSLDADVYNVLLELLLEEDAAARTA